MNRQYFVWYYKKFGNTYNLYYADTPEELDRLPEGAKQISLEKAEELARDEARRRKEDPSSAYRADEYVHPITGEAPVLYPVNSIGYEAYAKKDLSYSENPNYVLKGRVWEKVRR